MKNLLAPLALLVFAAGCGAEASQDIRLTLPPAETFTWKTQPIEFSPPPQGWERQRANDAGQLGVYYVKSNSVGEWIQVAEYTAVGKRDRCVQIDQLHEAFDNPTGFIHGERRPSKTYLRHMCGVARLWAPPLNDEEAELVRTTNDHIRRALDSFYLDHDVQAAHRHVDLAHEQASGIRYQLDDFLDRVLFKAHPSPEHSDVQVGQPVRGELAGEPAVWIDHSYVRRDRLYRGREVYVMHNNRLFVASFLGLEENLRLFDAIVETIRFPAGECIH